MENNQERILRFLSEQKPRAVTPTEISENEPIGAGTPNPLKPIWEALSRLEKDKKVFRFTVDGVDYFTLHELRNVCFALVKTKETKLAHKWNPVLGIKLPKVMVRTPAIHPLEGGDDKWSDFGHYRNRYKEGETNESITEHLKKMKWKLQLD